MGSLKNGGSRMQIQRVTCLKEWFINGYNVDGMMLLIIRELTIMVDTSLVTSAQILAWGIRVESHRTQCAMLDSLKETKDFDVIGSQKQDQK